MKVFFWKNVPRPWPYLKNYRPELFDSGKRSVWQSKKKISIIDVLLKGLKIIQGA